jgi:hypothetical protein
MQATYEPVAIVLIALPECRLTYSKQRQLSGACPQSEEEPFKGSSALPVQRILGRLFNMVKDEELICAVL